MYTSCDSWYEFQSCYLFWLIQLIWYVRYGSSWYSMVCVWMLLLSKGMRLDVQFLLSMTFISFMSISILFWTYSCLYLEELLQDGVVLQSWFLLQYLWRLIMFVVWISLSHTNMFLKPLDNIQIWDLARKVFFTNYLTDYLF